MKHLEEHNSLWLQADIWADGQKWDHDEIGIDLREWERERDRLYYELNEKDVFTWRTRIRTKKIGASLIEVKFFDKHGNSVGPVNHPGSYVAQINIQ